MAFRAFILVVGIYLLEIAAKTAYLYFALKKDSLGQYLLPGQGTNYFNQMVWELINARFLGLVIGLVLAIVLIILKKILKTPIVDRQDLLVLMLASLVVGAQNILILILFSMFLMVISQIIYLFRRKATRLELNPFLLVVTAAIMILSNFPFYDNFLKAFLRLD